MKIEEFIEKFAEAVEAESPETLAPETNFRELDEWSSLAALSIIALADEEFDVELSGNEMRGATTILDLYNTLKAKAE